MKTAEELKKELMELEGQKPAPTDGSESIADGDPELAQLMSTADGALPMANVCLDLYGFDIRTKEGAKKMLARLRKEATVKATVSKEELPMDQRITAVQKWRDLQPRPETWQNVSDVDLIERLTPHPDLDRLKDLSTLVCDTRLAKGADWKAYLTEMWTAIQEFHKLRDRYPRRYAPVMVSLESRAGVCFWSTGDVQDDEKALKEIFAYIQELQKAPASVSHTPNR